MNTTYTFQAEVRELLDIVVHALYSDKEVFVRELVSNASDALEKLRLKQLTAPQTVLGDAPLEISIKVDEEAKTLTITDTGIGMTREELTENLGTIAHSGTKKFLEAIKASQGSADVIGQFGVGFYSSFMVAEKVVVKTHSAEVGTTGWVWESDGQSTYTIEECAEAPRGTSICLHIKEECLEYVKESRIRGILRRYSNFVSFPLMLGDERVNTVGAVWMKSKNEVTAEEYNEFFKFIAHTDEDPLTHLHFSADAPLDIHALLFVPKENPESMGFGRVEPGVSLYCRRVLIDAKPDGLLPEWLRFVKGVVDSEDLPLNISREMIQDNGLIRKINDIVTKRFLKQLDKLATDEVEAYAEFYKLFSRYLKEGIITSWQYKESLGKLLRFESTFTEVGVLTSLDDYVSRMKDGQEAIYVLSGSSRSHLENSPYLEAFKARGLEVLFLTDSGDEFVAEALHTYAEKEIKLIDRHDIKLDDVEQEGEALSSEQVEKLESWLKSILGGKYDTISAGNRLVSSPVVVTQSAQAPSPQIREYLKAMGQEVPEFKPGLEFNPRNPLVHKLLALSESKPEVAALVATQLSNTALLSAGLLEDPSSLAQSTQDVLSHLLADS